MKISKLIKELEIISKQHGDIEVTIFDHEGEDGEPQWCLCSYEGKVVELTLGDGSWTNLNKGI